MLDDKRTYVKYILYVICEAQQIPFAVNILLFQLKFITSNLYTPREKYALKVTNWEKLLNYQFWKKIAVQIIYIVFIPNANSQHEVEKFLYYKNIFYFPSILT